MFQKSQYRPEIDGLRALSVFAVIFYHLEVLLPGGLFGVDVFFVISGYLITCLIIRETDNKSFTLSSFYERRARRILPSLYLVFFASVPFAWLTMLPKAMMEYASSVLSSLVFGSNIWFWQEDSYLAEPSSLKPFLHTWSLSIEEQFYFIYPILLLLLLKGSRTILIVILAIFLTVSFSVTLLGAEYYPSANFFFLPSRMWELLTGAVVGLITYHTKSKYQYALLSHLTKLGLLLVLYSFVFINDNSKHPGAVTLLPVIGTALILWFSRPGELVTSILSSRYFANFGLISYALYLWHLPVLVFAKLAGIGSETSHKILLILLSIALATVSYHFVEKPARSKAVISRSKFIITLGACTVILAGIMSFFIFTSGYPQRLGFTMEDSFRFNYQHQDQKCHDYDEACIVPDGEGNIKYVLTGDSHAGAISGVFAPKLIARGGYAQFTAGACTHLVGLINVSRSDKFNAKCAERSLKLDTFLAQQKHLTIIHMAHYNFWFSGAVGSKKSDTVLQAANKNETLQGMIQHNISKWLDNGHRVIIILQPPEFPNNPLAPSDQLFLKDLEYRNIPMAKALQRSDPIRKTIAPDTHPNLSIFEPTDRFCPQSICSPIANSKILYTDADHLSKSGAQFLWEAFEPLIKKP